MNRAQRFIRQYQMYQYKHNGSPREEERKVQKKHF